MHVLLVLLTRRTILGQRVLLVQSAQSVTKCTFFSQFPLQVKSALLVQGALLVRSAFLVQIEVVLEIVL